ncbi:MAG: hypothetical protein J5935_04995 [Lachnospiraceae bacterium]|nr:hypothetical protein [Lachnospiraceae bacterium]
MNSKWTPKRIVAVIAIVLLVGLYVLTLIAALLSTSESSALFRVSLVLTVVIPVLSYLIIRFLSR